MAEDDGMAEEVAPAEPDPRVAGITPERVQQIFELNQTMDDMVAIFMGLLTKTLDTIPDGPAKVAFMDKLQKAINQKNIEVKGSA